MVQIPSELPILPLRNVVVYPYMVVPISVGQARSLKLIDDVSKSSRALGLVTMTSPHVNEPGPDLLYDVGTYAKILKVIKSSDKTVRVIVQGLEKFRIEAWLEELPYLRASVVRVEDRQAPHLEPAIEALKRVVLDGFTRLVQSNHQIPNEVLNAVSSASETLQMAYLISGALQIDLKVGQELLEIDDVYEKLEFLKSIISRELEVAELGKKIQSQARSEIDKNQREYLLREQLKAIKKELGESEETQARHEELREKIETIGMSDEAKKEALRELGRLERLNEASAEYGVIQTYLDWITALPWQNMTEDTLDITHARNILNEDHFDLEKIKERLLEFLAVRKLKSERRAQLDEVSSSDKIRKEREGAILCFVGPPGVGKTSLGHSIARAMGREFTRLSLGGVRDEAEIRGHRRTYIGALPGRFIQVLRRIGTKNPVIMLDEIDKLGNDWRGDPSSALLEVLDPEQNSEFRDHYLDVAFDLSQVMFIATANVLESIPAPLRDRMEVINLNGYTEFEKLHIAQDYLIPRQIKENGLFENEIQFSKDALQTIIRSYTREAGVRNLERQIGSVCRKVAIHIAEEKYSSRRIRGSAIEKYLGKPRFFSEVADRTAKPGVATGLAYTPLGGDILFVEATRMAGKKGLTITGQLGDVMKESAQAALSLVRSKAESLGIHANFYEENDIHIHVPAGAIPKDGPSAGVTIVTALASLLTGKTVNPELGMTGEITLRGKVLPVGGIKEKILAAHRAGLSSIILPEKNEKDLEDLIPEVRKKMNFHLVESIEQVLELALEDPVEN